ncbi:cytochrome c oxidase assembly protein [Catenulispora rubra]|uniref:cytochrome c oxidase assembly protein n=1 Tax=Catenulispora rubra TaxID=280293 RepID=UPI001891FDA1|nr:cytochrome c oxidase assembly protein [Catenulispora rubra]
MPAVVGHTGPPELVNGRYLSTWTADPWMLALIVLAGGCYAVALVRTRRAGGRWRSGPAALFLLGLASLAVATMSFLGVYDRVLFWPRAAQNATLLMVTPQLLALGMPLTVLREALGPAGRRRLDVAVDCRAARVATHPALVSLMLMVTPFLLYFTGWYELTLRSATFNELLHLQLVAVGYLYFWTRLRADPVPRPFPHIAALWITFAEAIADGTLGMLIMLRHALIGYGYYHALGRTWGLSAHQDQILGGGALWLIGDLAGIPFLGAVWIRMIREDREQAAATDRYLDDLAAATPPDGLTVPPAAAGGTADPDRPWWETDPRLAHRYRRPGTEHVDGSNV